MTEGFKITVVQLFKSNIPALMVVIIAFLSMKIYFGATIKSTETKRDVLSRLKVKNPVEFKVHLDAPEFKEEVNESKSLKARITERGVLRVGYRKTNLPFTYLNRAGEVRGFDAQYAHELARGLNCKIDFVPFDRNDMHKLLEEGKIDVAMSGIPFSPDLLNSMRFSDPVMEVNLALICKDSMKKELSERENRLTKNYKLAVLDDNPFIHLIEAKAPHLKLEFISSHKDYFEKKNDFDALLISAEAGSAWTLYYPGYSVVIPKPSVLRYALSFVVAERDASFLSYLNQWLKVQEINGFEQENYNYWILGKGAEVKKQRWCIGSDVMGLW